MSALCNKRHEAFAKELARGRKAPEAYELAGYQACRQNASRLASNDDIKCRVTELKDQRGIDEKTGRDPESGRFLPGNFGYGGRPKGNRNKLGEQFIADLHHEWQTSGAVALQRVAQDDPVAFVKVVANVLPREIDATLTIDAELFQEVRDFKTAWALARKHIGADDPPMIELQAEDQTAESGEISEGGEYSDSRGDCP